MTSRQEHDIIYRALLIRKTEELLIDLYSKSLISGTLHTCIGQEFVSAALQTFLEKQDTIFSNHRGHGHYLAVNDDPKGLIAELLGRESGCCQGWGGSQHLHLNGFFSNGILGGLTPIAVGSAFQHKHLKTNGISISLLGDGALGEGVIYESFNFASKWALPILFIIENNNIAQTTLPQQTMAGSIKDRATAFDIKYFKADTWNWHDLFMKYEEVFGYVRRGNGPAIIEISTARLGPHSKGEETRSPNEISFLRKKDPLNIMLEAPSEELKKIELDIASRLSSALSEIPIRNESRVFVTQVESDSISNWTLCHVENSFLSSQINATFHEIMAADKSIFFLGEDVMSPYGGAFKIARGLSDKFPDRVISTPVSEALICGLGTGMALHNARPFIEIMFGDFITLAFDQILNHLAKFSKMYGSNSPQLNVTIRTPVGGGRGYGPTHSQNLEKFFLGIPGLRVLSLNAFSKINSIYKSLGTENTGATLLFEPKNLYSYSAEVSEYFPVLQNNKLFADSWIRPQSKNTDLTIICYGGASSYIYEICKDLFYKHDFIAQALCITQIYPFKVSDYLNVLSLSDNIVIVEDCHGFASFSSEVIAQLFDCEEAKKFRIKRISAEDEVIPASQELENQIIVTREKIINTCVQFLKKI